MNVHQWTPVTRDWVRIEDVTVDGVPVALADLTVALVTPRSGLTGATTWLPVTAHPDDGAPALLISGEDADPASATVIDGDRELHGKVSNSGTVVTAKLARITYS